jgi:hypothetical protein
MNEMKPMNTFDDNNKQAPNANDFLGGNYLKKEDIDGAITATVTDVWSEVVLNAGRKKLVVSFREFEKPLILNKTNIKRFARIFGSGDTTAWRGPVTVYVEAGVEYAGRVVGGIRVRPAEAKSEPRGDAPEQRSYTNGNATADRYEESEVDFF